MEENFRILKPYIRGLPIILLAMFAAFLGARKYLNYATPMFESTTKLRLADSGEGVPGNNLFKDLDVFTSANKIAVEIEVLKSQVLLEKVLDQLDFGTEIYRIGSIQQVELYGKSPITVYIKPLDAKVCDRFFNVKVLDNQSYLLTAPDQKEAIKGMMGDTLKLPEAQIVIDLNDTILARHSYLKVADDYAFQLISRQKLLAQVQKNLDVIPVDKDVAVIRISYKSPSPVKAANLANKLAEVYIQDYIETKFKSAKITVDFLDHQINDVSGKLLGAENSIQGYRDREGITNITQETETDLRKISQLKIQQTNLKMNLEAIQELDQYIQSGKNNFLDLAPNFEAFTDLLSTEIVKKIKALQSEKRDLLLVYTPADERVKVLDQKIGDLTSYLTESIRNTRKNLEVKYANLNSDISEAEKVFIGVPEKEKILNILNRDFQIYQQSYNFLNEKKIEAEIAQAAKIAFHRIITPAQVATEPVSPNRTIIKIVAILLGMFGAMFMIFLVHMLKARVNGKHSIETNSMIPIAAMTPKLRDQKAIDKHFLREAAQLEVKQILLDKSVVCISGFSDKEGSAFTALHLASALAMQNRKVLLADVENVLNIPAVKGQHPVKTGDHFDACSLTDPAFDRLTKAGMQALIKGYLDDYDMVLMLNKSLESPKSLHIMSLATVNFFVVDTRLTPAKKIVDVDVLQAEYQLSKLYFILNRVGYNPGVLRQAWKSVRKLFHRNTKTALKS